MPHGIDVIVVGARGGDALRRAPASVVRGVLKQLAEGQEGVQTAEGNVAATAITNSKET